MGDAGPATWNRLESRRKTPRHRPEGDNPHIGTLPCRSQATAARCGTLRQRWIAAEARTSSKVHGGLSPFGATWSTGSGPPGLNRQRDSLGWTWGLTKSESEQHVTYGRVGEAEFQLERRDIFCWVGFARPMTEHSAVPAGSGSPGPSPSSRADLLAAVATSRRVGAGEAHERRRARVLGDEGQLVSNSFVRKSGPTGRSEHAAHH